MSLSLQDLKSLYTRTDQHSELVAALNSAGSERIRLTGLSGSSLPFIAAPVIDGSKRAHLILAANQEDAAYLYNDFQHLCGEDSVFYFPPSYRHAYEDVKADNTNLLHRAEVLQALQKQGKATVVISWGEALAEKVISKQQLKQNTLQISEGERLSIDFVHDILHEYKFEHVDFVYEPGQYSIRGGIVDIFSFAHENPYRLEFVGNEVNSIRSFDAGNQLSLKKLIKVTVVPNIQDETIREIRESFMTFLPADAVIWTHDLEVVLTGMADELQKANTVYSTLSKAVNHLPPEELFCSPNEFRSSLLEHTVIEFGMQHYLKHSLILRYNQSPQPLFNKNFDHLYREFADKDKQRYRNIILASSARQIERLYAIFDDLIRQHDEAGEQHPQADHLFTPVLLGLHQGFVDHDLRIAVYTDHQIFDRYHRFRLKEGYSQAKQAVTLKELTDLQKGDYVTHIDHGIGVFDGLEKIDVNGKPQEAIRIIYKNNDLLYVSIHSLHRIARYTGKEGTAPKVDKLGSNAWQNLKQKTKKKVKELAFDLIQLYAKRKAQKGFQYSPDNYLQNELEASFIYEDTPDQEKTTLAVKKDMESPMPMDRLVCGDVGFGKTEIAIRAAFKAVCDSKQVAILVPTTILTIQHFKTFSARLKDLPCTIEYINRFKSQKQQKETLKRLHDGKVDIIIGTHKLLGKEIQFRDLGLLIIDEEQKFGVGAKDKLKTLRENVDTLTLTATPIPRTMQFSMMGARDLSVINTPPPNRYPVQTEVHSTRTDEVIRDAIYREVSRDGQVFFIHNRVQNLHDMAEMVKRLCPNVKIRHAHGQMDGEQLEEVMLDFIEGDFDVLMATTIIESGLDIPNANTIIINDAHKFGLSDLHQMRGRVGRSNKKAYCYLLAPPMSTLTGDARRRLQTIEQFAELGSGFQIAMRDLDIRGAGNLLGGEQSGFISDIGFETYQKILDEAVQELKENEFKSLFEDSVNDSFGGAQKSAGKYVTDCQIESDLEIMIPTDYVGSVAERLSLYKEISALETDESIEKFATELVDRFGPVPGSTSELLETIRLRRIGKEFAFEKITLKNGKFVGYFVSNEKSPYFQSEFFGSILSYLQKYSHRCQMKERNGRLTLAFDHIKTVRQAFTSLSEVLNFHNEKLRGNALV